MRMPGLFRTSGAAEPAGAAIPWGGFLSLLALLLLFPTPTAAQFTLFEGGGTKLELGGYLQSLTGIHDAGFEIPESETISGFNAEVLRLKWMLRFGENTLLEVHNRIQIQLSSTTTPYGGSLVGLGVSVVPGRSLDLSTYFIEEERVQGWHDIDRLSLTFYTGVGDVTVGRQAITWGISNLFPVADLWTSYSPYELDTEEKPGADALRVLSYPAAGLELDMVVADKGSADDLSAGIRASLSLSWADLHLAGGKFWNEILAMAGISAPLGSWKIRGEGVLPYDLDDDELTLPRITLGVDLLGGETMLSGEYHFNGIGVEDPDDYVAAVGDPRNVRGESYYLGRHYLGIVGSWAPGNDRLSLILSGMLNLQDGSAMVSPILTYDFGQETRFSLGGSLSSGQVPILGDVPVIRSEYGLYGDLLYTQVAIYF
jgi:hypothetical protein